MIRRYEGRRPDVGRPSVVSDLVHHYLDEVYPRFLTVEDICGWTNLKPEQVRGALKYLMKMGCAENRVDDRRVWRPNREHTLWRLRK